MMIREKCASQLRPWLRHLYRGLQAVVVRTHESHEHGSGSMMVQMLQKCTVTGQHSGGCVPHCCKARHLDKLPSVPVPMILLQGRGRLSYRIQATVSDQADQVLSARRDHTSLPCRLDSACPFSAISVLPNSHYPPLRFYLYRT